MSSEPSDSAPGAPQHGTPAAPFRNHPQLLQINTRVWLYERSEELGRAATLDDVPDAWIDATAEAGFAWVWLLGVWQTGSKTRDVPRADMGLRRKIERTLPDLTDEDLTGSPFAVQQYRVRPEWGGEAALARLRQRMAERGLCLMLDFVVNHVGLDHPWAQEHPEYLIAGSPDDLEREPHNYAEIDTPQGCRIFAHGRDPYFAGWTDTLQLNYRHAGLRQAMTDVLRRLAGICDGVRCDMAMLVQPDVIEQTWGDRAVPSDGTTPVDTPFWPEAMAAVRAERPDFVFVGEVYWDREWELQQQGFDFTYDKKLYDQLRAGDGRAVRGHLHADHGYQQRSVRFLENHDEPRAAEVFPFDMHRAAATLALLAPGMRFVHEGQLQGRRAHVAMQVRRRPEEELDRDLVEFYQRLLSCMRREEVHNGRWQLHPCGPAWKDNPSHEPFIAFTWTQPEPWRQLLVTVNYAPTAGQCYVDLADMGEGSVQLIDVLGDAQYERDAAELTRRGLYLDLGPWGHHVFELRRTDSRD